MGTSGSGKTSSLRNFDTNEVVVFNVASKLLPFRKKLKKLDGATYADIAKNLQNTSINTYVVDDAGYLMAFESFDKILETGYSKFTNLAKHFYDMIKFVVETLPSDTIVYFIMHVEKDETGILKVKTQGKLLDTALSSLEGLFSIVLYAEAEEDKYRFITQSRGLSTAKSPIEMFETEIDNDLKFVDDNIRDYYELPKRKLIVPKTATKPTKEKE